MAEIAKLIKRLKSGSAKRRRQGYQALGELTGKKPELAAKATEQLVANIFEPKEEHYTLATRVLCAIAKRVPKRIVPVMDRILHEAETGRLGSRRRASFLLAELSQARPGLCVPKLETLTQILNERLKDVVKPNAPASLFEIAVNMVNTFGNIALKFPKRMYIPAYTLGKCLNYPIYQPEKPRPELDAVYKSAARTLGIVALKYPSYIKEMVPALVRCHVDSYKYQRWQATAEDEDGMRQTVTFALEAVSKSRPDLIIPTLVRYLGHEQREVRSYATNYLGQIGRSIQHILPSLINCLKDPDETVCQYAAYAIENAAQRDPRYVVVELTKAINDPEPRLRQYAIVALALVAKHHLGEVAPALPELIGAIRDPEGSVRWCAVETLGKIGNQDPELVKEAIPYISNCLSDQLNHVRWCAVYALERIGERQPGYIRPSVPALIACLRDPYEHVRWRARETLSKLGVDEKAYAAAVTALQRLEAVVNASAEDGLETAPAAKQLDAATSAMKAGDYKRAHALADAAQLELAERRAGQKPAVDVMLDPTASVQLFEQQWCDCPLVIRNSGTMVAKQVQLQLGGEVDARQQPQLAQVRAGEELRLAVELRPIRTGAITLTLEIMYEDPHGAAYHASASIPLQVGADRRQRFFGGQPAPGTAALGGTGYGPSPYGKHHVPLTSNSPYVTTKRRVDDMLGDEVARYTGSAVSAHEPPSASMATASSTESTGEELDAQTLEQIKSRALDQETVPTKFCRFCGAQVPEKGIFCTKCGKVLR